MKALIVTLVSLWMGNILLWTVEHQHFQQNKVIIATDEEEEDVQLNVVKTGSGHPISLFQPTVYATLFDNVISVNLSELSEEATVIITRMATGEEIYSRIGMGSMEINLNAYGKGQYQIDVVSGELWLQGEFTL